MIVDIDEDGLPIYQTEVSKYKLKFEMGLFTIASYQSRGGIAKDLKGSFTTAAEANKAIVDYESKKTPKLRKEPADIVDVGGTTIEIATGEEVDPKDMVDKGKVKPPKESEIKKPSPKNKKMREEKRAKVIAKLSNKKKAQKKDK